MFMCINVKVRVREGEIEREGETERQIQTNKAIPISVVYVHIYARKITRS